MLTVRTYDRWMLFATVVLLVLGALMVYSSTSVLTPAMERRNFSEFAYLKKHLFTMGIGAVAMFFAYRVDRELLRRAAAPLLGVSFVLLMLVFMPGLGITAGGATRWIRLWPTTFQPSELVKLAMVIFMAWFLSSDSAREQRQESVDGRNSFGFFAFPVIIMFIFQLVFLKQPDFGAAMTLGVLTVGLLFISGTRLMYIGGLLAMGLPAVGYLLLEPYRLRRVLVFLDPWEHKLDGGFQLVQSFIAFGSGGLLGVGLGQSRQKLDFLPEVHTDFIFSMVGEELGFVAATAVVLLFLFIFVRGLMIAARAQDEFAYYLTFGLSMMIALQAVVNFAVVTGLLPTKGLPLPFLSYGGSSLLINMTAVGLLLNFSSNLPEVPVEGMVAQKKVMLQEMIERKKYKRRTLYGRKARGGVA